MSIGGVIKNYTDTTRQMLSGGRVDDRGRANRIANSTMPSLITPLILGARGRASGMNMKESAVLAGSTGLLNKTAQGMKQNREDAAAQKVQEAEAAKEEQRRRELVARIRGMFGIGATPEALANAQRMQGLQSQEAQDVAGGARAEAAGGYQSGLARLRERMAQSGQLGSSMDAQQRAALLQQHLSQRAGGQVQAQQSANQRTAQLQAQRQQLEQAVMAGMMDPSDVIALQNQARMYGQQPSFWQNLGGSAIPTAASAASNYAQQRALAQGGG